MYTRWPLAMTVVSRSNSARLLASVLVVTMVAACDGETPTSPTSTTDTTTTTTATPVTLTEEFAGRLSVGGYTFFSFTTTQTGTIWLTLTGVGGQKRARDCVAWSGHRRSQCPLCFRLRRRGDDHSRLLRGSLQPPVTATRNLTRFVVAAAAVLSSTCNEAASPTAPSAAVSPATIVYDSQLYPRGAASRTIAIAQAGSVQLTLTSVRPDSSVPLGVGLGIPRADGGGCHLSQSVSAASGVVPQLSATVDAGTYCVKVFDLGTLIDDVSFSVTIVHP